MEWRVPAELLKALYRAFPEQKRWNNKINERILSEVMERANLTPRALIARIEAWRKIHANMPPWDLANVPPSEPINTGLFAPVPDRPEERIAPADRDAREWASVHTSLPEVEDV